MAAAAESGAAIGSVRASTKASGKRRMTSSQRRSRENDKLRENLSDLAEALGFGDLYKSLVESDRRTERRAHLRKAQPAPTGFWKTEPI